MKPGRHSNTPPLRIQIAVAPNVWRDSDTVLSQEVIDQVNMETGSEVIRHHPEQGSPSAISFPTTPGTVRQMTGLVK